MINLCVPPLDEGEDLCRQCNGNRGVRKEKGTFRYWERCPLCEGTGKDLEDSYWADVINVEH